MAPRKGKEKKEEQVISLGPQVAEGENVFGVCHIFASFNDTFVHVTDLSGKYVLTPEYTPLNSTVYDIHWLVAGNIRVSALDLLQSRSGYGLDPE